MAGAVAFWLVRGGGGFGGSSDEGLYKPKCRRCKNFFRKDGEGLCLQGRVSPTGEPILANGSMITVKKCATAKDMRAPGAPCGPYGNQFLERDLTVFEILFRLGILIAAVSFVWWALSNGFYSQVITGLLIAGVVLAVPNIFVFQPFGMTLSFVFLVVAVVIMIFSPSNKKVSFDYCKSIGAERRYVGRTSLCEMPDGTVRIPK